MSNNPQTSNHCYLHLDRFSLLYRYYAIIDTTDYYADQLFIRHKVRVRFGDEYAHPDAPYLIIFCKVRKKDEGRFLDALQEMPNKMIICGHPDYPMFCMNFLGKLEKESAKRHPGKDNHESENRASVRANQETTTKSKRRKTRLLERRKPCDPRRAGQEGV